MYKSIITTLLFCVMFIGFATAQISSSIPAIKYYSGYYVTDSSDTVRNVQLSFDERVFLQKGISATFIITKGKDGRPKQLHAYDVRYFNVAVPGDTIIGRVVLVRKTYVFAREIISGPLKLLMTRYHLDYRKDAVRNAHARYCLMRGSDVCVIAPPLFRKEAMPFIQDCPQLAAQLENGAYNYFDIEKLVRSYNDWYLSKNTAVLN